MTQDELLEGLFAAQKREAREQAIRAVVAAQWAVAIVLVYRFAADVLEAAPGYERGAQDVAEDLASLAPPIVVVDGGFDLWRRRGWTYVDDVAGGA